MSQIVNQHAGRGAGKFRKPWEIRKVLSLRGTSMREVADVIGVKYTQVTETVKGIRNDRKVLAHLFEIGCPAHALSLPADLKHLLKQDKKGSSRVT